jgi:hypothetical protein
MQPKGWTLNLLLIAMFLIIVPARAATDFVDLTVKAEVVSSGSSGHGYVEYRATVTNRSATRAHQVTLVIPGAPYFGRGNVIREITRTVEVAAASTVTVSLLQPPLPIDGNGLAVIIDGRRQLEAVSLDSIQAGAWSGREQKMLLLVSQSVNKSGTLNQAGILNSAASSSGTTSATSTPSQPDVTLSYDLPVQEWSRSWLGYSRYDGVVVTGDDLRAMPEAVQVALWRYLECGGSMLVLGAWTVPPSWQARQDWLRAEEPEAEGASKGRAAPGENSLRRYHVGFGKLIVSGAVDAGQISTFQWGLIKSDWTDSHTPWQPGTLGTQDINQSFPIVEGLGTPVRGLFIMMLLFVIVIGPVNLMLLARRGKKIWLLWTVPAISLATCLAVSGYAFWMEGWSGHARTEVMTILDETAHQATTIGWTAFYAPLTPGDGLRFSYDTEVTPRLPWNWTHRGGGGTIRTVDWTSDQHLASGWVTARVPAHFMVRKSETRRERLVVKRGPSGALTVVNGLGADIRQLWWADRSGKIHSATNLQAGAQAALGPTPLETSGEVYSLSAAFSSNWIEKFKEHTQKPESILRPGCYLAVIDASPFLEEGLRGVKSRRAQTLVYGIQAEGSNAER